MAKHSMRGFYALGALVLGIILLYVIVRNVEPFANKTVNKTVSIYANISKTGNNISYSGTTDNSVTGAGGRGKITLTMPTNYKVQNVQYYKIAQNNGKCNNANIINNTACWMLNDFFKSDKNNTKTSTGKVELSNLGYSSFDPANSRIPSTTAPIINGKTLPSSNMRIDLILA